MKRPVIGCVPYINAAPLARWFETMEGETAAEIRYAPPSLLAEWLEKREVEVALVSSVESFRREETIIIPNIAIASEQEVLSVRLFSKKPFDLIQSVALDTSSLTSSALTRAILRERFGISPEYHSMPPDLRSMLALHDACLLIGDKGMTSNDYGLYTLDLGGAWHEWTQLPFVWAVWLANPESDVEYLARALHHAKAYGLANLDALVKSESARAGIERDLCDRYLRSIMNYDLTARHMEAMERFRPLVQKVGSPHS